MSPVVLWSSTCGMQQVRRGRRVIPLWNLGGRVAEQVLMRYLASFIVSTGNSARRRRQTRGALTASLTYSIHRLDPLGALSGASNGSSDHLDEARTLAKDLVRRRHNFRRAIIKVGMKSSAADRGSISPQCGVTRSAEPIGSARPAPRRDPRNTVSRARPFRCGTP
jgi:hypothetical protein